MRARTLVAASSGASSARIALIAAITSFLALRLSCSTLRTLVVCLPFSLKKWSQAAMNRFHTTSLYFLATGPTVFHSFWSATSSSAVFFQSVESLRASAFSHRACFFWRLAASSSFMVLKNSALRAKNSSHVLRKRANRSALTFLAAKPSFFHSSCSSIICLVASSQPA